MHTLPFDYRFANKTEEDINLYISYVINATIDFNYDGEIEGWDYFWHPKEFPKALLFTITIMTTIGRIVIISNPNFSYSITIIFHLKSTNENKNLLNEFR